MKANTYHQAPDGPIAAPPGCPVESQWSPLNDDYLDDPYPIAARLRDEHPVFFAEQVGHLVLTRMEDIEAVFTNPDVFASTNVQDPLFPLAPEAAAILAAETFDPIAVMSNRPEPDHGRIRVYTRQGFSHRRLKALEEHVRARAIEMIEAMRRFRVARRVRRRAGLPATGGDRLPADRLPARGRRDDQVVVRQPQGVLVGTADAPSSRSPSPAAWSTTGTTAGQFVAARRDERADDFCSELLDAHDADPDPDNGTGISYHEVESVVYGISFAGHDPVTALLCNTLRCLLPRRDQWDALVADPTLAANAVEETLRFESSQVAWRRIATRDTSIGDTEVPAGTRIFLNFAAANHQPDVFTDPDVFDIHRQRANRHISFGKGIHFCLGAGLARIEARIVLEVLAERVPSLRLVDGQRLTFFPNITFRGPDELLVEWDG